MKKKLVSIALNASFLVFAVVTSSTQASTTLTSDINADNGFIEYISTSATDLSNATVVQSGGNWGQTRSATTATVCSPVQ